MRRLILAGVLFTSACLSRASAPSVVASIQISSNVSPNGVFVGDQVQLNATPLDLTGNVVPLPITYSSSNTSVATIDNFGLITALSAGTSSIGISSGGQTVHLTLTVDGNVTGSVLLAPKSFTIAP
ncbi:MAG: Ig-like domain-containing protein, partial [Gemmatimonadales bacterium]